MGQELVALKAQLAEQSRAAVAELPPQSSGDYLSTKSGVLQLGDEAMPGNQVCVIVLDSIRENTFYPGKYEADNILPPTCFAFGRGGDEMFPHESMQADFEHFQPQHMDTDGNVYGCQGCPQNEWGSADTGKGKACKNRFRLFLIPAGQYSFEKRGSNNTVLDLFTDANDFAEADVIQLKLPPTSGEEWAKYVTQISAAHNLPPHGVLTRIYLEPHAKHQFHVKFEMLETVPDDVLGVVMARSDAQKALPIKGYDPPQEKEPAQAGGLKGLRRRG